jgi:hypothetical protein
MTDGRIYNLVKTKVVLVSQDQLFSYEDNLTDIPSPKRIEIKFEVTKEKGCQ